MIILLYGPDDYRRNQARRDLLAKFAEKHSSLGREVFDLAEEGGRLGLLEFSRTQSMFSSAKLAVLENAFVDPDKKFAKELKSIVERPEITVLVSERETPPATYSFLAKAGDANQKNIVKKFEHLKGADWVAFINNEATRRGLKLTPPAADLLANLYAGDSWRLITEIEKSACGSKKVIDRQDLEMLGLEVPMGFWELLNQLRSRTPGERLRGLEAAFRTKEPAGKLFNIIAYQWPEKLAAIAGYDRAIKSGKLDYEEALVDLAVS